jgi:hypothetical protein
LIIVSKEVDNTEEDDEEEEDEKKMKIMRVLKH